MAELQAKLEEVTTERDQLLATVNALQSVPARQLPVLLDLEKIRDQVVKNWRVKNGAEKKERIAEALDKFIKAIRDQGDKLEE